MYYYKFFVIFALVHYSIDIKNEYEIHITKKLYFT